jgi:hypothetical protein
MSQFMWVARLAGALILSYMIGWALLRLTRVDRNALGTAGRLACAWLLGAFATSLCLFLLSLCGLRASIAGPLILAVALVAVAVLVEHPRLPDEPLLGGVRGLWSRHHLPRRSLRAILHLIVLTGLARIAMQACIHPVSDWDGRAIWALKAKMLYSQPIPQTEYFHAMRLSFSHRQYPLLIPLMEVHVWTWLGRVDDWAIMPLFPVFAAALAGAVYAFARMAAGEWAALAAAAAVVTAPKFAYEASTGCCDVPLGAYVTVLAGAGIWVLRSPDRPKLLLMAAMVAGAIFTKEEGAASAAIMVFVLLAGHFARTRNARDTASMAAILALGLVISGPWLLFRATIPEVTAIGERGLWDLTNIGKMPPAQLASLAEDLLEQFGWTSRYGGLWLLVAAVLLLNPRRLRVAESLVPLAIFLLNTFLYVAIALVPRPPLAPEAMIVQTLPRLMTQLLGLAGLLLALYCSFSDGSADASDLSLHWSGGTGPHPVGMGTTS